MSFAIHMMVHVPHHPKPPTHLPPNLIPLGCPRAPAEKLMKMESTSSVAQSCPTLCNPMDCSTPGLPVHHQLPELTQNHVHWVSDTIQPSHPLSSPSLPAFNLSQHQGLMESTMKHKSWLLHFYLAVSKPNLEHSLIKGEKEGHPLIKRDLDMPNAWPHCCTERSCKCQALTPTKQVSFEH